MRNRIFIFAVILAGLFFSQSAFANALSISSSVLTDADTDANTIVIQFDVSWSNSWNDSVNHDAAWIFFKFSTNTGTGWNHATLSASGTNPSGYSQGSGTALDIVVPSDKKGLYLRRSALSTGSVSTTSIQVIWNYGSDGVADGFITTSTSLFKIFGMEMVYIPEGGFNVGQDSDGSAAGDAFFEYGSASSKSPQISSEEGIAFTANAADDWYYNSGGATGEDADGTVFNLHGSFPKGFQAFYMMKYEISQGQYRDYLNTISRTEQINRTWSTAVSQYALSNSTGITNRQGIRNPASVTTAPIVFGCDLDSDGAFDESTDGEWISCNYLRWIEVCSFLDWAALRPMSEFEFEKAARGPIYPVAGEYAWGSTSINSAGASVSSSGQSTEVGSSSVANAHYAGTTINGPIRVGFASTFTTATRASSGGSYYGAMDMTGNLSEMTVTIGNAYGRSFAGTHGDGKLATTAGQEGLATNADWPGFLGSDLAVSQNRGYGFRGGAWEDTTTGSSNRLIVANRGCAANDGCYDGGDAAERYPQNSGRGVRTA